MQDKNKQKNKQYKKKTKKKQQKQIYFSQRKAKVVS